MPNCVAAVVLERERRHRFFQGNAKVVVARAGGRGVVIRQLRFPVVYGYIGIGHYSVPNGMEDCALVAVYERGY